MKLAVWQYQKTPQRGCFLFICLAREEIDNVASFSTRFLIDFSESTLFTCYSREFGALHIKHF